jgi:formyltetrahydrofolate deformylase
MKHSAVLLIDCPDRPGLVARVATLLYERGANILHADQHQDHDLGLFFMRVEWALPEFLASSTPQGSSVSRDSNVAFDLEEFRGALAPLAQQLGMRWQLTSSARRTSVALFCSQYLHCVADLLERWRSGELECEIALMLQSSGCRKPGRLLQHPISIRAGHRRHAPKS